MNSKSKLTRILSIFAVMAFSNIVSAQTIKVGVMTGKEYEVAQTAVKVAKEKFNLDVELIEFNDGVIPNEAVNSGDIDLNAFQHKPFLDEQIEARGYSLAIVGNTFVYPIAAYSNNIKSIDELAKKSTVTLPNDPTNLGRSLLLIEKQGLIRLAPESGLNPTLIDIIENPKELNFVELDAPLLPASLDDKTVAFSVINTTWSSSIGLTPEKDGLFVEDKDSIYVNIIVSREDNKNEEAVKQFVKSYQSEEVYQKAFELFDGGVIKGW